jgi:hypothetical protein
MTNLDFGKAKKVKITVLTHTNYGVAKTWFDTVKADEISVNNYIENSKSIDKYFGNGVTIIVETLSGREIAREIIN